jgi:hypothetical protein
MINVYIETSVHAEWVATIQDEWTYMKLLPAFENLALEWGGIVTESVFEDTPKPCVPESVYLLWCWEDYDVHDNGTMLKVFATMEQAQESMAMLIHADKLNNCDEYSYGVKTYKYEK